LGTTSLVLGLAFFLFGFGFIVIALFYSSSTLEFIVGSFAIAIPLIVVGSLFLRKFDSDRKKEKKLR